MKRFLVLLSSIFLCEQLVSQNYCTVLSLPAALQTSVVAYFPFCGNANDVSGNNYNGVVTNATLTTDRFGNANSAYDFNGSNTRIQTSTACFNNGWNNYSISFWFNTSNTSKLEQSCFNTLPHNSNQIAYNFSGAQQNHVHFSLNTNPPTVAWNMTQYSQGTYTNYLASQWHHIVLTKTGTVWKQYLNGTLEAVFSSTAAITSSLTNIIFGAILNPTTALNSQFFEGKLDDYIIYNRTLNSVEVQGLYCLVPSDPTPISGPTIACVGTQATFSVAPINGATSYSWVTAGGWNGTGTTNIINSTPGVGGIFSLEGINSCGKSIAVTLTVIVNSLPTITAVTGNSLICSGQNALLSATGATFYSWNPGGGIGANVAINPTVTTTYTVTGTLNGCSNTATVVQNVAICDNINQDILTQSTIKIFPNPNNGNFIIEYNNANEGNIIVISDFTGREIIRLNENINSVNLIEAKGIYFVKLYTPEKVLIKAEKIIIE